MPPLEAVNALVSIMMSVSWSNEGKQSKLRHHGISRAHFQGTAQRLMYIRLPAEDRQKYGEDKVGRLTKSMYGTQNASSHLATCPRDPDLWRVGRIPKRQTQCRIVPQLQIDDVRMAVHFVFVRRLMDSNTSTNLSKPKIQRKTWEHLDSKIQT